MSRRRRHEEHGGHERWLVSYADLITLLFALFVVLYGMSRADAEKFRTVAEGMRKAFATGALPEGRSKFPGEERREDAEKKAPSESAAVAPLSGRGAGGASDAALALKERFDEAIRAELGEGAAGDPVQAEADSQGVTLKLPIQGMYAAGKSQPEADLQPLLDRIGSLLARDDRNFRVEGHADASEGGAWSLSLARAQWLANRLIEKHRIDPRRLGVAGYGANRPADVSESAQAHARNRRVEIVVLEQAGKSPDSR